MQMLDAALDYANRGWPIFPARADKTPYTENGVLDATTNPEVIRQWWTTWPKANIALDCAGAGFVVNDYDPGSNREGVLRDYALAVTGLYSNTPRGGQHDFYTLAEGEVVSPSASKIAPNVDVRSFHSYVLLPPSRTADGEYTWGATGTPAHRSDALVRAANTYRERSRDHDNWLIDPDLPENVERAIQWLKRDAKIAIEFQGGDNCAYATAAHMKSFGISEALAFDLMWEHWNPRCSPPWPADEADHLQTKVENGYRYNTSPPGNITDAYHRAKTSRLFKPIVREAGESGLESTLGRFRIVNRKGLSAIKPPSWLIPGFLPRESSAIIFGAPESFKTFIALDVLLSVATGSNFPWAGPWGHVESTGPVLFAAGEGRPNLNQRVAAWEQKHWDGKEVDNFYLIDPVPVVIEDPSDFISLAESMSPKGYAAIALDTVSRAMRGADENQAKDAGLYDQLARRLIDHFGCTVIGIAHTGHDNRNRQRGSNAFEGDADTVIMAERVEGSMTTRLEMTKQKDAAHWERDRYIGLEEVQLGGEHKSLVAMDSKPIEKAKGGQVNAQAKVEELIVMNVLDNALLAVLATNKGKRWTNKELAQSMAMREDVLVGSKTLENTTLRNLREDKGTKAHRCFDPSIRASVGQWMYRDA